MLTSANNPFNVEGDGKSRSSNDIIVEAKSCWGKFVYGVNHPDELCHKIVYSQMFQAYIFFCIIVAGVTVGLDTYPSLTNSPVLKTVDNIVLLSFIVEVLLKIWSHGSKPHLYFIGPEWNWNIFDVLIVVFSLPILPVGASQVKFLRMIRLMRLMKLFHKIQKLRIILYGFFAGLSAVGYIFILMMLIFYVYALGGVLLFRENDPWHFRSLEITMLNLLRIATFDAWSPILYINYYGCDVFPDMYYTEDQTLASTHLGGRMYCEHPHAAPLFSSFYCISFSVLISFCIFSLFIGAVSLGMTDAMQAADERHQLAAIQQELHDLQLESLHVTEQHSVSSVSHKESIDDDGTSSTRRSRFDYNSLLPLMTEVLSVGMRFSNIHSKDPSIMATDTNNDDINELAEEKNKTEDVKKSCVSVDAEFPIPIADVSVTESSIPINGDEIEDNNVIKVAKENNLSTEHISGVSIDANPPVPIKPITEVDASVEPLNDVVGSAEENNLLTNITEDVKASDVSVDDNHLIPPLPGVLNATVEPNNIPTIGNEIEINTSNSKSPVTVEPRSHSPAGVEAKVEESLMDEDVRQALTVSDRFKETVENPVDNIPVFVSFSHQIVRSQFYQKYQDLFRRIPFTVKRWTESIFFNVTVAVAIILATVVITLQTMPTVMNDPVSNQVTQDLLLFINIVFLLEVLIRVTAEMSWVCPWEYFYSFWNVFDLIVMVSGWLSDTVPGVAVLRLLRLFQMIKLLEKITVLHNLMVSVFASFSSIGYIGILLFLYIYAFALLGITIFGDNNERFSNLLRSMLHLFQFVTFDGWSDSLFVDMYGCAHYVGAVENDEPCVKSKAQFLYASMYYSLFVIIGSLVLLSLFIGIITSSMIHQQEEEASKSLKKELEKRLRDKLAAKESLRPTNFHSFAFITPRRKYVRCRSALSRENSENALKEKDSSGKKHKKFTSSIASSVAGFFSNESTPTSRTGSPRNVAVTNKRASSFAFGSMGVGIRRLTNSPPSNDEDINAAVASMVNRFSTKGGQSPSQDVERHNSLKASRATSLKGRGTSSALFSPGSVKATPTSDQEFSASQLSTPRRGSSLKLQRSPFPIDDPNRTSSLKLPPPIQT